MDGLDVTTLARTAADVATAHPLIDSLAIDATDLLVCRGAMDDARPNQDPPVDDRYLREALDAAAAGTPMASAGRHSLGCGIKWRP